MIKALVFDLDGVLVDAMLWHEQAFLAAARTEGNVVISTEEHRAMLAGRPTKTKLAWLVAQGRLDARKMAKVAESKQAFTQNAIELHCRPDPQRIALLRHFQGAGYQLGCVTNCAKAAAYDLLGRTQLLPFVEQALVTNEDVKQPKPDPEPYQQVCGLLACQPEEVLVFEDHDVGITSAFKAGCAVRKVATFPELTVEFVWQAIAEAKVYLAEPPL